ncbi:hypothetical protein ACJJTC_011815 [Scirpophaga incertulas]
MKKITAVLEDLYELIVKCKTNYKKSPKARITKGFLETRIQSLEDYWKSFKSAHQSLIKITNQEERKTIKYFIEEKYSESEEIYLDLKSEIADALELITTKKRSLRTMDISTVSWDPIVIFLTVQKLDMEIHKEWESHVSQEYQTDLPTLAKFYNIFGK